MTNESLQQHFHISETPIRTPIQTPIQTPIVAWKEAQNRFPEFFQGPPPAHELGNRIQTPIRTPIRTPLSKPLIFAWEGAQNRFPELFQAAPPQGVGNRIQTPIRTPIETPIETPNPEQNSIAPPIQILSEPLSPQMRNRPILSLNRIGTPIQTLNQNYSWIRP